VQTIGPTAVLHPDYGAGGGFAYALVPGSQPKYPVAFYYSGDPGPYPVPVPPPIENGVNSTGDRHAIMIDTTNCVLYELFNLTGSPGSWGAGSGAIWSLKSNNLRPNALNSANAAGTPIFPLLARYDEVLSGHINHAIEFTAPQTRNNWIWPARSEASSLGGSQYPPMGQRFRLKASVNISSFPPHVQVILTALKEYGMILGDNGAPWHIAGTMDPRWDDTEMHTMTQLTGADFEAVDESGLMVNLDSAEVNTAPTSGPAPAVPTGWVRVVSKRTGKCLDIAGGQAATAAGDRAQQWSCWNGPNQTFEFTPVNGGYKVTVKLSGMQLDMAGGPSATGNGVPLQQYPYWGGSNEIFQVVPTSDGYVEIKPRNSDLCLNVNGASLNNGAVVNQNSCSGADNQKWQLVAAQ